MSQSFPFEKFKHGVFFQVHAKDSKRIANRCFQIFDKDANKELSLREVKGMMKTIYKGMAPIKNISDDDLNKFLSILDQRKTGKIKEQDFILLSKKGALDYQNAYPEFFESVDRKTGEAKDLNSQKKKYEKLVQERFGNEFLKQQLINCQDLFSRHNKNKDEKLEYDEIYGIFEEIYKKCYFLGPKDKVNNVDLKRLLEMINVEDDGRVCYKEFEVFYLRSILSS